MRNEITLGSGAIRAAAEWTSVSETTVMRRPPKLAALRAGRVEAPPAASLTIVEVGSPCARAVADALRQQPCRVVIEAIRPFTFDDGTAGEELAVTLEPLPGMSSFQRHVFRHVGGETHHLIATLASSHRSRLEKELREMIASYQPRAAKNAA